jgi:uroporphyrinogen-III synthase
MQPVRNHPLLVLRPEPGNTATCRAAHAHGLHTYAAPLFVYVPREWTLPDGQWAGLLIGSAAVFAHAGPTLSDLRHIPVHAVGPTTARAAHNAGFTIATTGSGGLAPMVGALPGSAVKARRYLRVAGEERMPLTPPPGVVVVDVVVYAAQPLPLAQSAIELIRREPVLALLHSAQAARHFAAQCTALDLPRHTIALACLAPRIAQAAGENWRTVATASRPDDEALLPLAQQMCQIV